MKSRSIIIVAAIVLSSCNKERIENEIETNANVTLQSESESDTVFIDEISYYYLNGVETELENIIETDDQVWATHINDFGEAVCDVFSDDADFLAWWSLNGATQAQLDRYNACMEVRDYALAHHILRDYPDEENLQNLPQHFQDFVLSKIPDYYGGSNKNGSEQTLVHIYIRLHDGQNMTETNRDFTTLHSHYGSFRNDASSGVLVGGGVTIFCNWIWYGGTKWPFITLLGAQWNDLGTANNRIDSHF